MKCETCKSKMPDHLIVGGNCPICALTFRNKLHGLPFGTPFSGEVAQQMVEEAWQYYRPEGDDIYGFQNDNQSS